VPGDMGLFIGDVGSEPPGEESGDDVSSISGQEAGSPGLVGSPVSGLTNCFGRLDPSGLETRRMDLMGIGALAGLGDVRVSVP
jgi:hypothetical protein